MHAAGVSPTTRGLSTAVGDGKTSASGSPQGQAPPQHVVSSNINSRLGRASSFRHARDSVTVRKRYPDMSPPKTSPRPLTQVGSSPTTASNIPRFTFTLPENSQSQVGSVEPHASDKPALAKSSSKPRHVPPPLTLATSNLQSDRRFKRSSHVSVGKVLPDPMPSPCGSHVLSPLFGQFAPWYKPRRRNDRARPRQYAKLQQVLGKEVPIESVLCSLKRKQQQAIQSSQSSWVSSPTTLSESSPRISSRVVQSRSRNSQVLRKQRRASARDLLVIQAKTDVSTKALPATPSSADEGLLPPTALLSPMSASDMYLDRSSRRSSRHSSAEDRTTDRSASPSGDWPQVVEVKSDQWGNQQWPRTPFKDVYVPVGAVEDGELDSGVCGATRRKERRQGWSGEWNQPDIQDVIHQLRLIR